MPIFEKKTLQRTARGTVWRTSNFNGLAKYQFYMVNGLTLYLNVYLFDKVRLATLQDQIIFWP